MKLYNFQYENVRFALNYFTFIKMYSFSLLTIQMNDFYDITIDFSFSSDFKLSGELSVMDHF